MNFKILDKCFKNASRNIYYMFLIITIEFYFIFFEIASIANKLINNTLSETLLNKMDNLNPYHLIQTSLQCTSANNYNLCTYSSSIQIALIALILTFLLLYLLNSKYDDEQSLSLASEKVRKNFFEIFFLRTGKFFANFIFLLFHDLGIFLLFAFSNFLFYFLYSICNGNYLGIALQAVVFAFSLIFYLLFIRFYLSYVTSLNVIVQFHEKLSFHSDNFFSRTYDYYMIFFKILISFTNNLIIFEGVVDSEGNSNIKIQFCSIVIILAVFGFALLISLKILSKKIVFIINTRYNVLRIFFINFLATFLIFLLIFNQQLREPINLIITILIELLFSIFVTYLIYERNLKNIFNSKNLIYQIAYAISKRQTQSTEKLNEDIFHMFMMHKIYCNKNSQFLDETEQNINNINSKENTCKICEETEYNFETLLKTFYAQTKFLIKNEIKILTVEELELFTMIDLLYINIFERHKIIKLYFKISEILENPLYRNKSVSLCLNINRLKNFINSDNLEDIRMFRILKTYEETSILLKRIIEISEDIYTFYEFEKEIYKRAEQINIARNEIHLKIVSLLRFSVGNYSEDMYSLIIFKKLYEEIFNVNIDRYYYKFTQAEMDYKIYENFKNNRMLTIKYDVSKDIFLITKASNELKKFNLKKLEDIFPDELRVLGRRTFLTLIQENDISNFQFEFIIKDPNEENYIKNLSLKGKVCPSLKFDELIVNTTFEISREDYILFEENFVSDNVKVLRNFSKNMGDILCMNSNMLRYIKNYKFCFDDIFRNYSSYTEKVGYENFENNEILVTVLGRNFVPEKRRNNEKFECEINLTHYIDLCIKTNRIHYINDEENIINMEQLMKLKVSKVKLKFILNLTHEMKKEYNTFSIYSIKVSKTYTENAEENEEISEEDSLIEQLLSYPSTPSALSYQSDAEQKDIEYFQNSKQSLRSRSSTVNLNRLTYTATFFIFFLIFYSIIFMIIGISENSKIKESYQILMNFKKLEKTVYHTYTSIFNKFLLNDPAGKYNNNLYNTYFNNLDSNSNVNINFGQVAMIELTSKIGLIQQRMLFFQNVYMNSFHKGQVSTILSNQIPYSVISLLNGEYSVLERSNDVFENIQTFMNLAQIIFEVEDVVVIDFIDYHEGAIDFTFIKNKNYAIRQVYSIEIIVNFLNIFKQTDLISTSLQNIQTDQLNSIYVITLAFFITFVIFHLFLILICIYIIRSLRYLMSNYLKLIDNLFSHSNIVYMKKKLKILKNLTAQYFEDPTKLLKKLKYNKKVYSEKNRKEKVIRERQGFDMEGLQDEIDKNYSKWENSERFKNNKNELIIPIVRMITIVFFAFYIYAFIFYILIKNAHEKFAQSSLTFTLNSANENYLYTNFNLMQFNFFTRYTDEELYTSLTPLAQGENSYIKNSIQSISNRYYQTLQVILANPEFQVIFATQAELMNCTYIYSNLSDDVIGLLYSQYSSPDELKTFFIEICNIFPFMHSADVNGITQEIDYDLQNILFQYETNYQDVEAVVSVYNTPTLHDLYYILIYICRPIQQYINFTLIYGLVQNEQNFYLLVLLLFLSLNILVDLVILMFIKYLMIKKVLYISVYVENFIDAIRIV